MKGYGLPRNTDVAAPDCADINTYGLQSGSGNLPGKGGDIHSYFRNPDSNVTPGNEFTAEGLATWRLAEKIRIGPAVNFIIGEDNKKSGKTLADSGLMRLSLGGEFYYGRFDHVKISLAAYQDVLSRNTTEGIFVISRFVIRF